MEQFVDVVEREQVPILKFINICNSTIFIVLIWVNINPIVIVDLSKNEKYLHLIVITAQVVFPVEVKDPGAPVDFYINGKKAKHILSRARNGKQLDGHWTQLLV